MEQRSRWLCMCKRVVKRCSLKVRMERRQGIYHVVMRENEGDARDSGIWKKLIGEKVDEYGLRKWK